MKPTRLLTLLLGLAAGVTYAFLVMLIVGRIDLNVSSTYIFILPLVLGAIPVLFSSKEQLRSYVTILLLPVLSVFTFFVICMVAGYEGMICLTVIVGPFIVLGSIGAFIFRLIKLKKVGSNTPLYCSLLLPFLCLSLESQITPADHFYTMATVVHIQADSRTVWHNMKNVKDIKQHELSRHFVHMIGIPRPLNGELDKDGIGGVRRITWDKGIMFNEIITQWQEMKGFEYNIKVNPASIPPTTLDKHVMIGGKYFDVVRGSYRLDSLSPHESKVTLSCTYRITTTLNTYSRMWADFMINDFNETILQVIQHRSEGE